LGRPVRRGVGLGCELRLDLTNWSSASLPGRAEFLQMDISIFGID
jgi:hypothetical protein